MLFVVGVFLLLFVVVIVLCALVWIMNSVLASEKCLNLGKPSGAPVEALLLSSQLRQILTKLQSSFISDDGLVAYDLMKQSPIFTEYQTAVIELQSIDLVQLTALVRESPEEAMCFFLNM